MSKNFHMSVLALVDGRILNGIVLEETEQTLVLQTPTEQMVLLSETSTNAAKQNSR